MDAFITLQQRIIKIDKAEISRLLSAAVISNEFCQLLLTNPKLALDLGFQGERFHFSGREREQILAIQAENLRDFAVQLVESS